MSASAPPRPPTHVVRPAGRTPEAATSDAVLVRLAAGGDDAAFEALFVRHRPAVQAYAVRMLRDHGRAEDVVQDVFVSAMRALHDGREPTHVAAWLREVARRACIDQWRSAARRGEVSLDAPERLAAGDARRLADDDSLARATEDRESVSTLRRAFQDLPPLQHAVLVQRELEGRGPDEIAARLGLSRTVVEGQLARGRRALARAYRELQSGERCAAVRGVCEASLRHPLGVRERARLRGHLRTCDACRRHAHALGVEARLFDRSLAAQVALLLPLPLLRRWATEPGLASEAAGGALGAKVLVSAAVLAAGSGGVYVTRDAPAHGWPRLGPSSAHRRTAPVGTPPPFGAGALRPGATVLVVPGPVATGLPSSTNVFASPASPAGLVSTAGGASASRAPSAPAGDRAPVGPAASPVPSPAGSGAAAPGTSGRPGAPSGSGGPSAPGTSGDATEDGAPAGDPRDDAARAPAPASPGDTGAGETDRAPAGDGSAAPTGDGPGSAPAADDPETPAPVAPVGFPPAAEDAGVAAGPEVDAPTGASDGRQSAVGPSGADGAPADGASPALLELVAVPVVPDGGSPDGGGASGGS